MKFQEDSHYIERVINGDVSAYSSLVEKHKNLVFSIAVKILNNREDAEEIAQDTFLKAYASLKSFEKNQNFQHGFTGSHTMERFPKKEKRNWMLLRLMTISCLITRPMRLATTFIKSKSLNKYN